ncbi:MAG: hypothetical protein LBQ62_11125 [Candidatus Accumulibacter sp.]|jgi:hypothetical protein|nr:hypothetical protein [Accumulibacter sp.]
MSFGKYVFAVFLCLSSSVALPQSIIYHCMKDGKKLVSDQPCEKFGSEEKKRVRSSQMPPLNTAQGLTKNERKHGQAVTDRLRNEEWQRRAIREYQESEAAEERKRNEKKCSDLWYYKEQIINQQRRKNDEYWNEEHRKVNDEIFHLNCGS